MLKCDKNMKYSFCTVVVAVSLVDGMRAREEAKLPKCANQRTSSQKGAAEFSFPKTFLPLTLQRVCTHMFLSSCGRPALRLRWRVGRLAVGDVAQSGARSVNDVSRRAKH